MTAIEDTKTEAAVVAELQRLADGEAHEPIKPGEVYLVPGEDGLDIHDTDAYAERPRHVRAQRTVTDAKSFVDYVNRHKLTGSEVFAHTATSSVVAVLDSHEPSDGAHNGAPGWQGHTVRLVLEHTKSWLAWTGRDLGADPRAWFDQAEFADFIEQNALDVRNPEHGTLIDIATTFEAKQKADFESAVREHDGSVRFGYVETVAAKAGQKGELTIPKEFELALRPYIGGPVYKVVASFRYRIGANGLRLGYALQRPEVILEAAFTDIVNEIRDGRHDKGEWPDHDGIGDVPIFSGKPQ
jgi:uncharacterized protein YfdQ (DUF2303 family)